MIFGPFQVPGSFEEIYAMVRAITSGLTKLTFGDNFESFEVTSTIGAGAEVAIRNEFRNDVIPTRWIIVDATGGNQITRGPTAWSKNFMYLKNNGAASATVIVRFFR